MPNERKYTSRRQGISQALADKLALIDGRGLYHQSVAETSPKLKFWDEVEEFPAIHLNAGSETRQYQLGGYKDRFFQDYIGSSNTIRGWELPDTITYKIEPYRFGHEYLQTSIEYRYEILTLTLTGY